MPLTYKELWISESKKFRALSAIKDEMEREIASLKDELEKEKTEKSRYMMQVHQFSYDELTGLPSRRLFEALMEKQLAFIKRANYKKTGNKTMNDASCNLCLLEADIDKFKQINDVYGHDGGDQTLRLFGDVVRNAIRHSDIACRWGGDEFVIALPDCDVENAAKKALQFSREFHRLQMERGQGIVVSVSVGLAIVEKYDEKIDSIVKRADKAMYKAKEADKMKGVCACFSNIKAKLNLEVLE